MDSDFFDYCKDCCGRGHDDNYDACPTCNWNPKKLTPLGHKMVEFLQELKVHIEVPFEWY